MPKRNSVSERFIHIVASRRFFWAVAVLLVIQAAWIALSSRYPMAFDEDFHLGIIRLYAHHISPFWSGQPSGADAFGAVARDPSYLYHWLMSFPYRFISLFTQDQTIQVILLRLINIGLFASGLVLFRRLLLKLGASRAIAHFCLLIFILIPVVPLLAAQINYDNLFMPLTAGILLFTIRFQELLRHRAPVPVVPLVWLLTACLVASIVKYPFLPIFIVILGFIVVNLYKTSKGWRDAGHRLWAGVKAARIAMLGLALAGFLLTAGLNAERYGYNLVKFHSPIPACDEVLDYDHCISYGPWARDYRYKQQYTHSNNNPLTYAFGWVHGMWFRLVFAVAGPATNFETKGALLLPAIGSIALSALGFIALGIYGRQVIRQYNAGGIKLLLSVSGVYIAVLWVNNYMAYLEVGRAVAVNGRYLLPMLPFLLLFFVLAVKELCRSRPRLTLPLAALALLVMLWGGGALTYILRSNDSWYWLSQPVLDMNHAVKNTIGPLTPGYHNPNQFLFY